MSQSQSIFERISSLTLADPSLLTDRAFVGGEWVSASGARFHVRDPFDGSLLAELPDLGTAETRRAIEAAARAQGEWARRPAKERAGVLKRWYNLVIENADDLSLILTAEQGKPLAEGPGRGRVQRQLSRMVRGGSQAPRW